MFSGEIVLEIISDDIKQKGETDKTLKNSDICPIEEIKQDIPFYYMNKEIDDYINKDESNITLIQLLNMIMKINVFFFLNQKKWRFCKWIILS
ncbi:MAG: hypothetical protein Ta2E_01090 [Mycoplasmoidaceae bacterium]|nr:MAG: hypothetical protein Ta2E_01090 [Mycoplasmoidaceae bacterium]